MASKKHPHTSSVEMAAARMEKVISSFSGEPRFMQTRSDRTEARHARIDSAAPDVRSWKDRLPLEMVEKLARMDME